MSTFTQAQTAQKLDPIQEFLKEFEAKLPKDLNKDKDIFSLILKDWLYKSGNFLAMFEEIGICDELVKEAFAHQKEMARKSVLARRKEIMRKSALSKMAKNTNKE